MGQYLQFQLIKLSQVLETGYTKVGGGHFKHLLHFKKLFTLIVCDVSN